MTLFYLNMAMFVLTMGALTSVPDKTAYEKTTEQVTLHQA